jgi:hypothetical protein
MAEHDLTLPWRNDDPYPDVIVDSNGEEVASCSSNEDCDFIVKAVNSHDALVKALEGIAEFCSADATKLGAIERLISIRNTALNVLAHVGRVQEQ